MSMTEEPAPTTRHVLRKIGQYLRNYQQELRELGILPKLRNLSLNFEKGVIQKEVYDKETIAFGIKFARAMAERYKEMVTTTQLKSCFDCTNFDEEYFWCKGASVTVGDPECPFDTCDHFVSKKGEKTHVETHQKTVPVSLL